MIDLFVSYSTKNKEFVESLINALENNDKKVWWDRKRDPLQGISEGTNWWAAIQDGISDALDFLFVLSPSSAVSPYCHAEISIAIKEKKRIITLLYCEDNSLNKTSTISLIKETIGAIDPSLSLPPGILPNLSNLRSLAKKNWQVINLIEHIVVHKETSIQSTVERLNKAIELDIKWARVWNDFNQAVKRWNENNKHKDFLWPDSQLKPFLSMAAEYEITLNDLQKEFATLKQDRLLDELKDTAVSFARRMMIGIELDELSDKRPGVNVIGESPDIEWGFVPKGEVEWKNEYKASQVYTVQSFWIAKYPITYAQFALFRSSINFQSYYTDVNGEFASQWQQYHTFSNHPADNISWFDAMAFCRWISDLNSESIRLPTECEWVRAADAIEGKIISTDSTFNVNVYDNKSNGSCAVGLYPQITSHFGVLDLIGNVWEWCINDEEHPNEPIFSETLTGITKGGSWKTKAAYCNIYNRSIMSRIERANDIGFRIVKVMS